MDYWWGECERCGGELYGSRYEPWRCDRCGEEFKKPLEKEEDESLWQRIY